MRRQIGAGCSATQCLLVRSFIGSHAVRDQNQDLDDKHPFRRGLGAHEQDQCLPLAT